MKSFVTRVKNLSQKAAELKAAVQQIPPKVAEMRETIAATTGQLQQLKSEIHFSVADLKVDSEERLSEALQEINDGAEVFAKAGFALSGVDIEISPVQRMQVHLARLEDVHASVLRSLISHHQQHRTLHAILSAMLQAKQMADTVELNHLDYDELMVTVGPVPVVRLCWRGAERLATQAPVISVPPAIPATAATATPPSVFGQSSFFEKRSPENVPAVAMPLPASVVAQPPHVIRVPSPTEPAVTASAVTEPAAVVTDPLARFKKMPNLYKKREEWGMKRET